MIKQAFVLFLVLVLVLVLDFVLVLVLFLAQVATNKFCLDTR